MPSVIEDLKRIAREMGLAKDEPTPDPDKQPDDELARIAKQHGVSVKIAKYLGLNKQKYGGVNPPTI